MMSHTEKHKCLIIIFNDKKELKFRICFDCLKFSKWYTKTTKVYCIIYESIAKSKQN